MTPAPPDPVLWSAVSRALQDRRAPGGNGATVAQVVSTLARGEASSLPAEAQAEALLEAGNALLAARAFDLAAGAFRYGTECAPRDPRLHNGLGVALAYSRRHPRAADAFKRARELAPNWLKPWINEAEERALLDDNDGAERLWNEVARRAPDDPRPRIGLAMAIGQRGDLERASELARAAAAAEPGNPRAWQVVGLLAQWSWRHDEALAAFRRMQALAPSNTRAWSGIGAAHLANGDWAEGFAALERRRHGRYSAETPLPGVPAWTGEALAGTLVAHTSQGFGDMLMHARFLAALRGRVARIVVLLDGYGTALARTFGTIAGVDRVIVDARELASETVAASTSLTSLAFHAGAEPPFEAQRIPYLRASEASRDRFAQLGATRSLRVGVAWSVSVRDEVPFVPRLKSVPASVVARWMDAIPDIEWHSLQPGEAGDPAAHGLDPARLRYHGSELVDFDATAALTERMDLVISADTSVAHLAGALGRPVWLVDRANCCWRYRLGPSETPWYPSMRIFRQSRMRDWSGPADAVERALGALHGGR